MAFACDIDPDRNLGTVTLRDTVGAREFMDAMRALYDHPEWQPGFSALWDGSDIARLIIEPDDLAPISETYRQVEAKMGRGRAAFVVPRDVVHVIAQLLIHRLHYPDRERRAFVRLGDAVAWLNEDRR